MAVSLLFVFAGVFPAPPVIHHFEVSGRFFSIWSDVVFNPERGCFITDTFDQSIIQELLLVRGRGCGRRWCYRGLCAAQLIKTRNFFMAQIPWNQAFPFAKKNIGACFDFFFQANLILFFCSLGLFLHRLFITFYDALSIYFVEYGHCLRDDFVFIFIRCIIQQVHEFE